MRSSVCDIRRNALRSLIPPMRLQLSVWIEATGWMDARARLCAGAEWPVFL
jgi:hypothetical protein